MRQSNPIRGERYRRYPKLTIVCHNPTHMIAGAAHHQVAHAIIFLRPGGPARHPPRPERVSARRPKKSIDTGGIARIMAPHARAPHPAGAARRVQQLTDAPARIKTGQQPRSHPLPQRVKMGEPPMVLIR